MNNLPLTNSLRISLLVLLLACAAPSQPQQQAPQNPVANQPPQDAKLCDASLKTITQQCALFIADASRGASPELHALALLLLVESKAPLSPTQKIAFAREAFEAAASAPTPIKKRSAVMVLKTDTDAGFSAYAFEENLDRFSLQTHTLSDIEAFNPALARQLLADLKLPDLPPVPCTEALTYDPAAYFDLLQKLARNKTANLIQQKDITTDLLAPALSLPTHAALAPAFALLANTPLTNSQLQELTQTLIAQIAQLRGDERSFQAFARSPSSVRDALKLYQALESHEHNSGSAFLHAYRQYLVDNYRAGACGELWIKQTFNNTATGLSISNKDLRTPAKDEERALPDTIQGFNLAFSPPLRQMGLEPISITEIDTNTPLEPAKIEDYWQDSTSSALLAEEQQLRFNSAGAPRTQAELNSSALQSQTIQYLEQIDQWSADPFSSERVFEEKIILYMSVLNLTDAEEVRQTAIEKALSLFENTTLNHDNPALWLAGVSRFQRILTYQSDGDNTTPRVHSESPQLFLNSSNSSLHLLGLLLAAHLDPFHPNSNYTY